MFPKCVWIDNIDIVWHLFIFQCLAWPRVTVFQYFQVKMSLLTEPHEVELSVSVPEGIAMTRVLVERGVYLLEVLLGVGRVTLKLSVYGDVLLLNKTVYPSLIVLRFTV